MKKPVNKFAVGLWALATIYVVAQVWLWVYNYQMNAELIRLGGKPLLRLPVFLDTPAYLVMNAAVLAALGILIEIGDKIRWVLERRAD